MRLQNLVTEEFNQEFKRYLLEKGVNIDISMFDPKLQEPNELCKLQTIRT